MFTSRQAIQANTPAKSGNQFFQGAVAKKNGPEKSEKEEAGTKDQKENQVKEPQRAKEQSPGEKTAPTAQNTTGSGNQPFFSPASSGAGNTSNTFFPPKAASPQPQQRKNAEKEVKKTDEELTPEQEPSGNEEKKSEIPQELPPPPAGAHLMFATEMNSPETSPSQAESGHKSDIKNQMEMETQEAKSSLSMNPKMEEGKPTVFEPENQQMAPAQPEPLKRESQSKELEKPVAAGGKAASAEAGGGSGTPQADGNPAEGSAGKGSAPAKQEEIAQEMNENVGGAMDGVQLPVESEASGVQEVQAMNKQPMTTTDVSAYLKDPRSDAEKRNEQRQYATNFATEVAAAKARVQEKMTQSTQNILQAQQIAAAQLISGIQTAVAQINAQFAQLRARIGDQFAQASAQLEVAKQADLASADALQIEKTTAITEALNERRTSFESFVTEQQQQPYVSATKEADRADSELESAAADCIRQGNEIAARNNKGEDGEEDARKAVLELARESASDIRAKKPVIREDVMARAADFDGNFGQYRDDTIKQIGDIEAQLVPAVTDAVTAYKAKVEEAYSKVETSLSSMKESRIKQADQQEQQLLQGLQSTQEQGLKALEENAYNAIHGVEMAGQQAITAIEEQGSNADTLLTPSDGLPDLDAIRSLYDQCLAQLQQTEAEGIQNMESIEASGQQENERILSQSDQDGQSVNQQAVAQSADMLAESQGQVTQIITGVTTSMQQALTGITTSLDQTREEALAGLDQSIEERKGKMIQANSEFAAELTTQVDTSIEKAKQPLLDVLIDRLLSAEYKAKASWWEGLLLAIADFLILLIVLVIIAAVLVFFEVFATIAAALMVIGLIILAVVFIVSLVGRLMNGEGWLGVLYAIFDTVGITAIYEAVTNKDIYSGKELKHSTFERWFGGTSGVLQVITIISPLKNKIPGVKRITFPELPGWARFVEFVEGAGKSRRNGSAPLWDRFIEKLFGKSKGEETNTGGKEEKPNEEKPKEEKKDEQKDDKKDEQKDDKKDEKDPEKDDKDSKKEEYQKKLEAAKTALRAKIKQIKEKLGVLEERLTEMSTKSDMANRLKEARKTKELGKENKDSGAQNVIDAEARLNGLKEKLAKAETDLEAATSQNQVKKIEERVGKIETESGSLESGHFGDHGLSKEASDAIELLEKLKHDPVGEVNSEPNKNHYGAARLEAKNGVLMKDGKPLTKPDGTPYSHIRDLQNAFDALGNVKTTLEGEFSSKSKFLTDEGLEIALEKLAETKALMQRLRSFLEEIGWPPERPHKWTEVDGKWVGEGDLMVMKPRTVSAVKDAFTGFKKLGQKIIRIKDASRKATLDAEGKSLETEYTKLEAEANSIESESQVDAVNQKLKSLKSRTEKLRNDVEAEERF